MPHSAPPPPRGSAALSGLVQAGLLTGLSDGLFATVSAVLSGSTVTHLWQSVSSTLLGPSAFERGIESAMIGVLMHFGVAFGWSAVFLGLLALWPRLRALLASPYGPVKVAAVYGPFIWLVMSLVVIPLLVQQPPTITYRWWVQLIGHFPFVGLPIAWVFARSLRARS
jgi:hypothetical protein